MSDQHDPAIHVNPAPQGEPQRANTAPSDPPTHPGYASNEPKPPRKPTRLSSGTARKRRQERTATKEFVLEATLDDDGNPTSALVRKPNIFDADELQKLPKHMQAKIFELIDETELAEGTSTEEDDGEGRSLMEFAQAFGSASEMADAYCVAGFVEPRCYADADEADAQGGVWVKDIDFQDRIAFLTYCTGTQREAAAAVRQFRERPVDAAHAGPARDAVSGAGESEPDPAAPTPVYG